MGWPGPAALNGVITGDTTMIDGNARRWFLASVKHSLKISDSAWTQICKQNRKYFGEMQRPLRLLST